MDQSSRPDPTAPAPVKQTSLNESFRQLDAYAEQLRVKLPLPPPGLVAGYIQYVPWIAMVVGVLGVVLHLGGYLGVTSPVFSYAYSLGYGSGYLMWALVGLVIAILQGAGGYLMLSRRALGWWLLAAAIVLAVLQNLLTGLLLALIVWLLVAYVHLEVKQNYR